MMRVLLTALMSATLLASAAETSGNLPAGPGEDQPDVAEWVDQRMRAASLHGDRLATVVFDLLEDLELYKIEVKQSKLGISVGRRVFDNHDVLGSFTVVDRFSARVKVPLVEWSETIAGPFIAKFAIGLDGRLEFVHVRQTLTRDLSRLLGPEQEVERLQTQGWDAETQVESAPIADSAFNGLNHARFSKLWNLLAVPMRVPLSLDWIERIQPGEIISYRGSGSIEAGPALAAEWGIPGALEFLEAEVFFRVFVHGSYEISILREDAHYAQVKIGRTADAGVRFGMDSGTGDIWEGFTVVNSNPSEGRTTIIPFSAEQILRAGRSRDVVYRYDLRDPDARSAFHRATLGMLAPSDLLCGGDHWRDAPVDAPVRRVGERSTEFMNRTSSTNAQIGFVYKHQHARGVEHSDIDFDLGAGLRHVARSQSNSSAWSRFVWGTKEATKHRFDLWVDLDRVAAGGDRVMTLTVTQEIVDTDTSGSELREYCERLEAVTGHDPFFPRVPIHRPQGRAGRTSHIDDFDRRLNRDVDLRWEAKYGRSSFFAQCTYSQDQIDRFLAVPTEERWGYLEDAFGMPPGSWSTPTRRGVFGLVHFPGLLLNLPLYLVNAHLEEDSRLFQALRTHRFWLAASRETDPRHRAELLAEMFSSRRYAWELAALFRKRLAGEAVAFTLTGTSYSFGTLRDEGTGTTPIEPLPERWRRAIDIDDRRTPTKPDPQARIDQLTVRPQGSGRLRIRFTVPADATPKALYVRLDELRPWRLTRTIGETAVARVDGLVVPGANELILDRSGGFLSELMLRTEPGLNYTLQLALSQDGRNWGRLTEAQFDLPEVEEGNTDPLRPLLNPQGD